MSRRILARSVRLFTTELNSKPLPSSLQKPTPILSSQHKPNPLQEPSKQPADFDTRLKSLEKIQKQLFFSIAVLGTIVFLIARNQERVEEEYAGLLEKIKADEMNSKKSGNDRKSEEDKRQENE